MQCAARAGIAYDQTAVPAPYLSLSSLDFDKWLFSFGGGLAFTERARFDFSYVYVRTQSETVAPEDARLPRINPLSGNAPPEHVNGGRYGINAHVLSGAMAFLFD
jgi:long-subunit fatty acid transport protein